MAKIKDCWNNVWPAGRTYSALVVLYCANGNHAVWGAVEFASDHLRQFAHQSVHYGTITDLTHTGMFVPLFIEMIIHANRSNVFDTWNLRYVLQDDKFLWNNWNVPIQQYAQHAYIPECVLYTGFARRMSAHSCIHTDSLSVTIWSEPLVQICRCNNFYLAVWTLVLFHFCTPFQSNWHTGTVRSYGLSVEMN